MYCKDCEYFNRKFNVNYGTCESGKIIYSEKVPEKGCVTYMDYDWYNAEVSLDEYFGCIHFKEKPLHKS